MLRNSLIDLLPRAGSDSGVVEARRSSVNSQYQRGHNRSHSSGTQPHCSTISRGPPPPAVTTSRSASAKSVDIQRQISAPPTSGVVGDPRPDSLGFNEILDNLDQLTKQLDDTCSNTSSSNGLFAGYREADRHVCRHWTYICVNGWLVVENGFLLSSCCILKFCECITVYVCLIILATPSTEESGSRSLMESQEIGDNYFAIGHSDQSSQGQGQGQQQAPLNPETIEKNKSYLKSLDNFQVGVNYTYTFAHTYTWTPRIHIHHHHMYTTLDGINL